MGSRFLSQHYFLCPNRRYATCVLSPFFACWEWRPQRSCPRTAVAKACAPTALSQLANVTIRVGLEAALKIRQIKHVSVSPSSIFANPGKNQNTLQEKNAHLVGQQRTRLACVLRRLVSVSLHARFQRQALVTQFARSAKEKIQRANVTKVAGQANRSTRPVITHANALPS